MKAKQTIVPHLWFDKEAREAAEFYCSALSALAEGNGAGKGLPGSAIANVTTLEGTPSGSVDHVSFDLAGHQFMAISAGPHFRLNPSVSFMLNFDPIRYSGDEAAQRSGAREDLDTLWEKLSDGGTALMPLDKYAFSERYGWVQDKYGVSWQLILSDAEGEERPFIIPSLLFTGAVCGKAEEATEFYLSVFKNAERGLMARYPAEMEPDKEGTVMFTDFILEGRWFAAMDSAQDHRFSFNEAISFVVYCDTQDEIDAYWSKLSAVPEAEQCGWVKDAYGVSWQIVPRVMDEMMSRGTREQVARVTRAFLPMKKLNILKLQEAYDKGK